MFRLCLKINIAILENELLEGLLDKYISILTFLFAKDKLSLFSNYMCGSIWCIDVLK